MFINSKTKRFLALLLTFVFVVSVPITALASTPESQRELINVVVSDTDEQVIIAQVPIEYVDKYQNQLEDPVFRQEQIEMMKTYQNTRALPEGKIIDQRYFYKSDIKRAVNAVQPGAFESLLSTLVTSVALGEMMKILGVSNPYGLISTVAGWAIEYIRVKPENWWNESYIMILEGTISCVRISHIQNLQPTYPAAWLILERI